MIHFTRIAAGVDVAPLKAELAAHPELWNQHGYRRTLAPHAAMADIWVRYRALTELTSRDAYGEPHIPVWYPAADALPSVKPIVHDLMARVEGEMLCGVLITRIPPGAGIGLHHDEGWHVAYTEKFYVSVQSAPGARFYCAAPEGVEWIEPNTGEIWLFDNRKPHFVQNDSPVDRITLIVCIRTAMFGRP
jgi:hypothetical protein